jgi:hypothetical protein
MKKIIIFLILLTSSGYAQFWKPKATPTPAPTTVAAPGVTNTSSSSLQEARVIILELNNNLLAAKEENKKLKLSLSNAETKITNTEKNTEIVQKNADSLRTWGIARQNEAFEWMAKHEKILKRYHYLKLVASVVGGVFGFVFGIWLMRFVPPIYAAYAVALPLASLLVSSGWVWLFF